jgi:hypothetical protein
MSHAIHVPLETPIAELFSRVGILDSPNEVPAHLDLFLCQADRVLWNVREMVVHGEMTGQRASEFQQLLVDACARVMCHPIVASNNYLRRFAEGISDAQAKHECQQFSVFALQFDVAQARLVANAPTEEAYHQRLNVLLNEKGIPYEEGFEGELSGRWRDETVHFTWMRNMAGGLGLAFEDVGKIWLGHPGTVAFTNATFDYYGSSDLNTASGAAFAIENWAANSLWKPWILGMQKLNSTRARRVNIGYLTYHDAEEEHHSQATLDELLENFVEPWFDAERFLSGAEQMLTEGVQAYYESQLAHVPEFDDSWPARACEPRKFDPATMPRLAVES